MGTEIHSWRRLYFMKVAIIDYGMGNIKSISSALSYVGVTEIILTREYDDILAADKIILPGVGSFSEAILNIRKLKLDKYLYESVVNNKTPILGICLGMQLLGESSDEGGMNDGLGFIPAKVTKFKMRDLKIPHVGFNQVDFPVESKLYEGLKNRNDFYFTHSYKMDGDADIKQSMCNYGGGFIASYEMDNVVGTQFHPEISQTNGLKLLENFIENF